MEIKRYFIFLDAHDHIDWDEDENGGWVMYEDHESALSALQKDYSELLIKYNDLLAERAGFKRGVRVRNYKFRVWDKKKEEWAFGFKECGGFHLFGELHVLGYLQLDKLNDYVAMQFTGIKDKNGKEIYEGDIVSYKYGIRISEPEDEPEESWEEKKVVEFKDGQFTPRPDGYYPDDLWYGYKVWDFEIIGNIYENPELLEAHDG